MTLPRERNKPDSIPANKEALSIDFEALFQKHWHSICGALYYIIGDWDEAEDLALETFWQLYKKPPKEPQNLGGWLYRVATNLGLNALRSRKRRQYHEQETLILDSQTNSEQDPAAILEQTQERQRVRLVLSKMKERSAQLLILRQNNLSYAQIAQALDIKPASVGTLIARAEKEFEQGYSRLE
jgi:RNA polymerase sigma-70 factor (ECF subfamily)